MKKILATAYAVDPFKGSENGMGWNFILQIATYQQVIAITRKNNRQAIEDYMNQHPDERYENITFHYFDLPKWARWWKKKERGAMLYFYLWQMFVPLFVKKQKLQFDIAHNVNFHNNWTPTFLWALGKPVVWGPVGHHPRLPLAFSKEYGKSFIRKENVKWMVKNMFWKLDPFLRLAARKSDVVIGMNSQSCKKLGIAAKKEYRMPSVSSEERLSLVDLKPRPDFHLLSVGRFVPLKAFDLSLEAFAMFYYSLPRRDRKRTHYTLVGKGPLKTKMQNIIKKYGLQKAVTLVDWVDRENLIQYYHQASLFMFPSHEGAGMVVSEALSYGLPVICLDNEGPGEFIQQKGGIKVRYTNPQEAIWDMHMALRNLFSDRKKLEKMQVEALAHFQSGFNWAVKGDQLRNIYNSLGSDDKK